MRDEGISEKAALPAPELDRITELRERPNHTRARLYIEREVLALHQMFKTKELRIYGNPYSMDTQQMIAGRELDALIAEKVMGWKRVIKEGLCANTVHLRAPGKPLEPNTVCEYVGNIAVPCLESEFLPKYSTSIAAAWEVVEKFKNISISKNDDKWECEITITKGEARFLVSSTEEQFFYSSEDTALHAICLAALKAV